MNPHRAPVIEFPPCAKRLTPREIEVMEFARHRRADIATVLQISERTVQAHLRSIYAKLGVETRAAAVETWQRRAA